MRYIKIFEDFYSKILYHGSVVEHGFSNRGNLLDGSFFSTSERVAGEYGKYITKVELMDNLNIFNTINDDDLKLLFNEFDELHDTYYSEDEEEYHITSPDDLDSSDTWEPIENTDGVVDWIRDQEYDGIWVYEGGVQNLFLFSPVSEKIKTHHL